MELSQYAKQQGISYRTAFAVFGMERLRAIRLRRERLSATPHEPVAATQNVAVYASVDSAKHRVNFERQVERLSHYCEVNGYLMAQILKEIASGVHDSRPKLLSLLKDTYVTCIVIEHLDRLLLFGFHCPETLLETQGRMIEVRITVNDIHYHLRECSTHLEEGAERVGGSEASRVIRRRVSAQRTAFYAEYAEECTRQMDGRHGEAA